VPRCLFERTGGHDADATDRFVWPHIERLDVFEGRQRSALTTPTGDLGPFYPIVRGQHADNDLTLVRGRRGRATGQIIEVSGRVLNRNGDPVSGVVIELWQANAAGRYAHPSDTNPAPIDANFQGFAKLVSGRDGSYCYTSIKPGAYPDGDDSPRPPHVHLDVSGKTGPDSDSDAFSWRTAEQDRRCCPRVG
jgi:protocatechuate 3,4-dioxygenase beta subunit